MKVLYLYSGTRKDKFKGKIGVDYPDTQFYGLNHLGKFGIEAEFKEPKKSLGFRLRHFLMYFTARKYDIVFGSSILYMAFWKKIIPTKTKFVLLNISLGRTIAANKNRFLKRQILSWILKEIDAVVCLTSVQKEYLERSAPFLKDKIYPVPLGVDTNYYRPVYKDRKNYILSAGRDNGRDYKTVVETAKLMPEEEFHIVCSKRNLEGLNKIPKNVKIFFDLPLEELVKKYGEAKLLLLITHDDNFLDGSDCSGQTVLLDAMASGLPVVASRKKYLKDYAEDGREILLVDFYSPANIMEKINVLNNNTEMRLKQASNARERAEKELSTESMAKKLAAIFNGLINAKKHGSIT